MPSASTREIPMTDLASLLGRKPASVAEMLPSPANAPANNVIEPDQEPFPIAAQLGEESVAVRNLLIDAGHIITELSSIKHSLGRVVDPICKTLRAFEEAKTDKLNLQSVLNET